MYNTSKDNFHTDVVQASRLDSVVVLMHASWCGPCKGLKPILERLALEQGFTLVGVDAGADRGVAAQYNVRSVPALLVFDGGVVTATRMGGATEDQLRSWLAAAGVPPRLEIAP